MTDGDATRHLAFKQCALWHHACKARRMHSNHPAGLCKWLSSHYSVYRYHARQYSAAMPTQVAVMPTLQYTAVSMSGRKLRLPPNTHPCTALQYTSSSTRPAVKSWGMHFHVPPEHPLRLVLVPESSALSACVAPAWQLSPSMSHTLETCRASSSILVAYSSGRYKRGSKEYVAVVDTRRNSLQGQLETQAVNRRYRHLEQRARVAQQEHVAQVLHRMW